MAQVRWSVVQNDDTTWEVMDNGRSVEFGFLDESDATYYVRNMSSDRQQVRVVYYDGSEVLEWA